MLTGQYVGAINVWVDGWYLRTASAYSLQCSWSGNKESLVNVGFITSAGASTLYSMSGPCNSPIAPELGYMVVVIAHNALRSILRMSRKRARDTEFFADENTMQKGEAYLPVGYIYVG